MFENGRGEHRTARSSGRGSSRESGIFSLLLIILLLTVLVIAISVGFGIQMMETPRPKSKAMTSMRVQQPVKSGFCSKPIFKDCKDALSQGYNITGLLTIKPNDYTSEFQVFCDMSSGGGGWTLVASVHEDDISSSCDSQDKWSKESSASAYDNWFNMKSFGDLEDVTGEDYKSKALYALNASDMMIWHVPNDLGLPVISSGAFFKYHTTNGFLQKYGSNLQTLFTQHFPMTRYSPTSMAEKAIGCVQKTEWSDIWRWSFQRSERVNPVRITRSDNMTIKFNAQTEISINRTGNFSVTGAKPIEVAMRKTSRVTTTMVWIPKPYTAGNVNVKVDWGTFGRNMRFRRSSTSQNEYYIRYGAQCGDSHCKVLFTITNSKKWGGQVTSSFSQTTSFYLVNNETHIEARTAHLKQATLVGYTVFQRKYDSTPGRYDWTQILDNIPSCFDDFQTIQYQNLPSLSVPASFIKGNMDFYASDITPGFIEFRKYGSSGYPYPICPGIRLDGNADPSLHCIGGLTTGSLYSYRRRCGDFSAWDQLAAHKEKRANSTTGGDVTDLTSTLLLFYR